MMADVATAKLVALNFLRIVSRRIRRIVVRLAFLKDAPWARLSLESRRAVVSECKDVAVFCSICEVLTELC